MAPEDRYLVEEFLPSVGRGYHRRLRRRHTQGLCLHLERYCQINNEKPRWNSVDIRVLRRGESFITSSLLISGVSADGFDNTSLTVLSKK